MVVLKAKRDVKTSFGAVTLQLQLLLNLKAILKPKGLIILVIKGNFKGMKLIPVVLSGGSGTRLWPMSRMQYPKQFCKLLNKSLQTLTLERLKSYQPSLIVTSENLKVLTQKEISENNFAVSHVIYEPEGKNTAVAIAVACRYLELHGQQDQVVGVFSSDALISNTTAFHAAVEVAVQSALENKVVVLGIRPERVETGFGYIQISNEVQLNKASAVLKFHEKPDFKTAENFVRDGHFFWNAGIFIFKVSQMLKHFQQHYPQIWKLVATLDKDLKNLKQIYAEAPNVSIDVAIIEKLQSENLTCVPCDIGWSDLGSWDVLEQIESKAKSSVASAENQLSDINQVPFQVHANGNTVFSSEKKVYGLVGVDDLIVVDTEDALLICKKGQSQKVKDLVEVMKVESPEVLKSHNFEVRPWGQFEILKEQDYYKSKVIKVNPGQKLSYQSHQHRSEHWVIVKGQATVVLDDKNHDLVQGQHIFIPAGSKHRIINNSKQTVEFIEVQVGVSFEETDIVRYQDDYGR